MAQSSSNCDNVADSQSYEEGQRSDSKIPASLSIPDEDPPTYSEAIAIATAKATNALTYEEWLQSRQTRPRPRPRPVPPRVAVLAPVTLGKSPKRVQCPNCHSVVTTSVRFKESTQTHLAALCCCLFCGLLCTLIPYCIDDCKDAHHECPSCNMELRIANS